MNFSWSLPGLILGKEIQITSSESQIPADPWLSLWSCQDQGVNPVGFARAGQYNSISDKRLIPDAEGDAAGSGWAPISWLTHPGGSSFPRQYASQHGESV